MKKVKNKAVTLTIAIVAALSLSACGGKKAEETELETITIETQPSVTETETVAETEKPLPEGMMYSYLTGEVIKKDIGLKRPYGIMINNIEEALPQYGIQYADIIYEAKVEHGITRLMAVIQDLSPIERIGSIRSARHNYIDFARDNEAIYVHYGQSSFAQNRMDREGYVSIHGLSDYETSVFYRASDRYAPHDVFTNGDMLAAGLSITGLSRNYPEGYTPRLLFNKQDTVPTDGIDALKVNIPFDSAPYFTYNTEDGLYYRYQYGQAHIDAQTGTQLAFKNIIVQYVAQKTISDADHQDMTLNGSGSGYYISDGKAVSITWSRADDTDKTRYYDASGKQISLNPGKTFFEVVPDETHVTIEGAQSTEN